MSWRKGPLALAALAAGALLAAFPAQGQYPGQIDTKASKAPVLRSIAVLEWTGKEGKPKTSRLIPVCIYDGQDLQDGGLYLARPQPLSVDSGVEYVLEKNGRHVGLYDIRSAGQQQGAWVGFGAWKPMPKPKPETGPTELAQTKIEDDGGGRPVLHRRKEDGDNGTTAGKPAPAPDPDRPTLTRARKKEKKETEVGYVESLPKISDPGRPRLLRGKPKNLESVEIPGLKGMPVEMDQMVAVSDATNRPAHVWSYSWSNPEDEQKMKAELEDAARKAMGLDAPKPKPAAKRRGRRAKPTPQPETLPAPLLDEHFRVFQLTYTSGATLVLTARSGGLPEDEKFVTLIAQPDLYGNLRVLFQRVTDERHLDISPRMRLVDAVDVMADNRGELLFELRGRTHRQFALYRVMGGSAEQIFATGNSYFTVMATE